MLQPMSSAHGTVSVRDVALVEWRHADGAVGWGECPTLPHRGYSGETTDDAWAALTGGLAHEVVRGTPIGETRSPMAVGALRDAALDADLRARGRSLVEALGGIRRPLPMCRVSGLPAPGDAAGAVGTIELGRGEALRKFKVTPETLPGLRLVRERHPELPMAADANGSFLGVDAVPPWLDDLGLAYLEQPLAAGDLEGHAELRRRFRTPVALDEGLTDVDALQRALQLGAVDVVSVKPARLGGVRAAAELLELAASSGLGAFVGGMLETGVGRASSAAVATHPAATLPTDLGPSERYFAHDLTQPVLAGPDGLLVPEGPGSGVSPEQLTLEENTVERVEVS
jgi:O-succinylbenzoate synthase